MDRNRRFSRLGSKLVGVSVLGLALAFVVFYLVDSVAVAEVLYSDWFTRLWQSRNEAAIQAYQDYVTEQGLTAREVLEQRGEGMNGVASTGLYTLIGEAPWVATVQPAAGQIPEDMEPDANVSYNFVWAGLTEVEGESPSSVSVAMEMYEIQCADGVVFVSPAPAALRYAGLGRVAGLLLALLAFCLVVVPYIVHLLRRIGALSREAEVLMAGDLEHRIHVEGHDELSGLGEDIERLRRSVLERILGEREAVTANSRLITSISHDLRTPLTKLTGYLDILAYQKYQTREEHDNFLRLASEKAAQIKALTDQMFASAQVDASQTAPGQPPEVVDGAALLGQLLEEQCSDLRREGFDVRQPVFDCGFQLYLHTADAVRIFDNLFSNLKKYADPASPVQIQADDDAETVTLRVGNQVRRVTDRSDSHGMGVPTMRELLERSGGTLEVSLSGGRYESLLTFLKYLGPGR